MPKKVGIDPGHGGIDPGAVGKVLGLKEKDVTLDVSLELERLLQQNGFEVVMTRREDTSLVPRGQLDLSSWQKRELFARSDMLNAARVDLVVSVHVNSVDDSSAKYVAVFIIGRGGQAEKAAQVIQDELRTATGWPGPSTPDGIVVKNLHMVRETDAPAALVEMGFISNSEQEKQLQDQAFRRVLAVAIARGVCRHFGVSFQEKPAQTNLTPIMGEARASSAQAQEWARKRQAHQRFIDIAPVYWQYGSRIGIRPEIAYAQAAKETAFGRYGGAVRPEQNNWAGIKTKDARGDRPEDHESFPTPEDGVRAHFNHLAAYVGVNPIGEVHGRYYVVKSLSWAGTVKIVEELGGKWAPNADYGKSIVSDYLEGLLGTQEPIQLDPETQRLRTENEQLRNEVQRLRDVNARLHEHIEAALRALSQVS